MPSSRLRFLLATFATSILAFLFYETAIRLASADPAAGPSLLRIVAAVVAGAMLAVRARQRVGGSIASAATEAFGLGVVVVVTNSLMGSNFGGRELAVRTTAVLVGLPLLAVLAQAIVRVGPASRAEQADSVNYR